MNLNLSLIHISVNGYTPDVAQKRTSFEDLVPIFPNERLRLERPGEMCIRDRLYTINAIDKAIEIGMGKRTNTILQSAFFKLADVMPIDKACLLYTSRCV